MNLKKTLSKEQISEIEAKLLLIAGKMKDIPKGNKIGLLDGNAGIGLFYFYFSRQYQLQEYYDFAMDIFDDIIKKIGADDLYDTYCSGIAGAAMAIDHICEEGFIDGDASGLLNDIDDYLLESAKEYIKNKNIDFIHGSVGHIWYLLNRYWVSNKKMLELFKFFINTLENERIFPIDKDEGSFKYNLGLAHGLPSLIILLCKMAGIKELKADILPLIIDYSNFLHSSKLQHSTFKGLFPAQLDVGNKDKYTPSRLAWCYGDLGIAICFANVFEATGIGKFDEATKEVVNNSIRRFNNDNDVFEHVNDPMFCHGSAGIAYLFSKLLECTNITTCKGSYRYWIDETFKFSTLKNGIEGFRFFDPAEMTTKESFALLNGLSGVGLAYLSFVAEEKLNWDKCLMLS